MRQQPITHYPSTTHVEGQMEIRKMQMWGRLLAIEVTECSEEVRSRQSSPFSAHSVFWVAKQQREVVRRLLLVRCVEECWQIRACHRGGFR
jgi:hypothetical protein